LTDCDQGLSEKIITLEHRINALSFQLDSQQDSQLDRQQENPDMGTVVTVEAADKDKPVTDAIGPVPGDSPQLKNQLSEAVDIENRQGLTNDQLSKKIGIPTSTIEKWKGKIREGEKVQSTKYPDFFKQWTLNLADSLWYEID
jgi:hypothetical protein